MEEINKVVDITVAVIIFVIAISVNVFLYASVNKSINEVLSINETDSSIIVTNEDIYNASVKYTASQIFFMVQNMIEQTDVEHESYVKDEYSPYNLDIKVELWDSGVNSKSWANLNDFLDDVYRKKNMFGTYFNDDFKYTIDYIYEYVELDELNVNNHKIKEIKFTKI